MEQNLSPFGRRETQVLQTLHEHGPMSVTGLLQVIEPQMHRRSLNNVVKNLFDMRLIVRRFDSLPLNCGHYYQLSYRKDFRKILSFVLDADIEKLTEPQIGSLELIHSQECAVWSNRFKYLLPNARVLRENVFTRDQEVLNVLLAESHTLEVKPDLMLMLPKNEGKLPVRVAVEIERCRKTNHRLIEKLRKFTRGTRLDGVIYICGNDGIEESIRQLYSQHVRDKAFRINNYAESFMMFLDPNTYAKDTDLKMLGADRKNVNFHDWIHFLSVTSPPERRNQIEATSAEAR